MECQHCKSKDPKTVIQYRANKHAKTRLYCKECQKYSNKIGAPKILLLDIETSKAVFELYDTGKQYVGWKSIVKERYIMGWAAKWLFDNEVISCYVTPKEAKERDDRRILKKLYKLMNDADMIVAHNGNGFDFPVLYATFARYNFIPNNRQLTMDTYRKAKQVWKLPSYSLGYLLQYFGFAPKMKREDTDLAEHGDKQALLYDETYCRQDVLGLEDLYLKLRGWMKTHPNLSIYFEMYNTLSDDETYCPRCQKPIHDSRWTKKWRSPMGAIYKSCNCPHCGAVLRKASKRGWLK